MAGNIKEFLTNEELAIEIKSETATLHICDPMCEEITDDTDQEEHHSDHHSTIVIWVVSSAVAILLVVIIVFVIYKYVCSIQYSFTVAVHLVVIVILSQKHLCCKKRKGKDKSLNDLKM